MIDLFRHVRVDDERGFALHSGGTSHVLFNVMGMLYEKETRDFLIGELYRHLCAARSRGDRNLGIVAIVGVEFGGAPIATLLAERFDHMPLGFYRPIANTVIGLREVTTSYPGAPLDVLVVDDVVTTGVSMSEACRAVHALGYETIEACIVDRRNRDGSVDLDRS